MLYATNLWLYMDNPVHIYIHKTFVWVWY